MQNRIKKMAKMSKFVTTFALLLVLAAFPTWALSSSSELTRTKRQAQQQQQQQQNARTNNQRPVAQAEASLASSSSASASSMASSAVSSNSADDATGLNVGANRAPAGRRPTRPKARPVASVPLEEADSGYDQDDESGPVDMAPAPPHKSRRPARRQKARPERFQGRNEEFDDEDCDEQDYRDYGNMFSAAFRPMRQMGDMMGNMFEHMQSLASGDFEDLPTGSNFAVASSRSDGSGYSRHSSIVSNNGKRRGVISETRNGRTQTRRIGDDDLDE